MSVHLYARCTALLLAAGTPFAASAEGWPAEFPLEPLLSVVEVHRVPSFTITFKSSMGAFKEGRKSAPRYQFLYEDSDQRRVVTSYLDPTNGPIPLFSETPVANRFFLYEVASEGVSLTARITELHSDNTTTNHEIPIGARHAKAFREDKVSLRVTAAGRSHLLVLRTGDPVPLPLPEGSLPRTLTLKGVTREGIVTFVCSNGSVSWLLRLDSPED